MDDLVTLLSAQGAAVVFLGNPLILWPALIAVAICLRDWIVTRRVEAFLVLAFYFGPYLAWASLPRTLAPLLRESDDIRIGEIREFENGRHGGRRVWIDLRGE